MAVSGETTGQSTVGGSTANGANSPKLRKILVYGNARFDPLHGLARVGYLCILRTDDLLGDVPDSTVVVKEEQSVGSGDVVKRRRLLVAEEHVWNPDLGPTVVAELQLAVVVVALRVEHQTTVVPLLTQVHTQREILHQSTAPPTAAVRRGKWRPVVK